MAFVYRSERKINLSANDKLSVGPGQYIKINHLHPTNQTKVPFNSSNNRDIVKLDSTPGPGSYNIQQSKSYNDISRSINTNTSTVDLNSSNPISKTNEKLGFLTKVNRFQENEIYQAPGPGYYDINKESLKEEKKHNLNLLSQRKNAIYTGSIKRIVTIPSKEMHGYVVEDNGNALMLLDSLLNKDPSNKNKQSEIGPGSYEIPSNWKANAIEWKKTCNELDKKKKQKKNEKNLIEELKRQGDFVPKLPMDEAKKLSYSRVYNSLSAIPLPVVKRHREREMSYIPVSESPGPGYYTKEFASNVINDVLKKNEQNKCYGSQKERFKENEYQDNIGPTSYFQPRNKYDQNKYYFKGLQSKSLHKTDEVKIEAIKQINKMDIKAGPGSYDLAQGFLKKAVSSKELFDSGIQRFYDIKQKEGFPGPGTYIEQQTKPNIIIKESLVPIYLNEPKQERYQLLRTLSPPVGSYHPEVFNSIQYQISSKVNPSQANIAPFNKTGKRFDFAKVSNIGPGAYSKEMINVNKYNKDSCFNTKDKRFRVNENNIVSPADYDVLHSVEWDKKSFNVLFFRSKN